MAMRSRGSEGNRRVGPELAAGIAAVAALQCGQNIVEAAPAAERVIKSLRVVRGKVAPV